MNKITIRFDGGCKPTNPGNKYGSYEISMNGKQIVLMSRIELGWGTNNEAEFDIFEEALRWTVHKIILSGNEPKRFILEAYSDSVIVINRLNRIATSGKKEAQRRMANCCGRCLNYTQQFKDFKIIWNKRDANVDLFGH